jgi:hypothetical protein
VKISPNLVTLLATMSIGGRFIVCQRKEVRRQLKKAFYLTTAIFCIWLHLGSTTIKVGDAFWQLVNILKSVFSTAKFAQNLRKICRVLKTFFRAS